MFGHKIKKPGCLGPGFEIVSLMLLIQTMPEPCMESAIHCIFLSDIFWC